MARHFPRSPSLRLRAFCTAYATCRGERRVDLVTPPLSPLLSSPPLATTSGAKESLFFNNLSFLFSQTVRSTSGRRDDDSNSLGPRLPLGLPFSNSSRPDFLPCVLNSTKRPFGKDSLRLFTPFLPPFFRFSPLANGQR